MIRFPRWQLSKAIKLKFSDTLKMFLSSQYILARTQPRDDRVIMKTYLLENGTNSSVYDRTNKSSSYSQFYYNINWYYPSVTLFSVFGIFKKGHIDLS